MKQALIIFAKNLISGQVKTRLAAAIGNDMAVKVYRGLLQYTASITSFLPVDKIVFYSNHVNKQDVWENEVFKKELQSGNDLGERMKNAFIYAFEQGNKEVAIIGTDCFELTPAIIMNGFAYLKNNDVVIGPANDGGYYLLAMKQTHCQLFCNIEWSTKNVLETTLEICSQLNLSFHQLPRLTDIDTVHDLNEEQKSLFQINE